MIATRRISGVLLLGALVAALGVTGCGPQEEQEIVVDPPLPQEFLQKSWAPQEPPVSQIIRRDYRLREGDYLEIIYHVKHIEDLIYQIKLEDVLVVRFPFNSELNQVERVQSDGKVYLDLIGPVKVAGWTIDEVHDKLKAGYTKYLKEPTLTVSFKESNVKIKELKEAIVTSPRGQSRLVPITPDGTIQLPFIVETRAAGLTISELHRRLNKAYADAGLSELEVTVNVQTISPLRIYVMGEVLKPGMVLNYSGGLIERTHEVTLLQALALAGSYIPGRSELSQVVVIRRRHLPRPQAAIINVYQLLENRARAEDEPVVADTSKHRYDIWLEDGDIVYVPTSAIAKRADYIHYVWTRGIRAVGGFSSYAGYNVNDAVDWLGPNP